MLCMEYNTKCNIASIDLSCTCDTAVLAVYTARLPAIKMVAMKNFHINPPGYRDPEPKHNWVLVGTKFIFLKNVEDAAQRIAVKLNGQVLASA